MRKASANRDGESSPLTTVTFDCFEPDGRRRFRAHCYIAADEQGNLSYAGSGRRLPDPKVLIIGDAKYVIATGESLTGGGTQAPEQPR